MKRHDAKADKRRLILEAATSCFAQNGFAATRLDDIAERAGVAKGTIYLHFENKDALYIALFRETLDELFETIDSAILAVDDFAEKARRAIGLYLEFFEHNREKFSIFLQQLGGTDCGTRKDFIEFFLARIFRPEMEAKLLEHIRAGHCRNHPPRDILTAAAGMVNAFVHRWFLEGCTWSLKSKAKVVLDVFLKGIATP